MRKSVLFKAVSIAVFMCSLAVSAAADNGTGAVVGAFMIAALPLACFCAFIYWLSNDNLRYHVAQRWMRWRRAMAFHRNGFSRLRRRK